MGKLPGMVPDASDGEEGAFNGAVPIKHVVRKTRSIAIPGTTNEMQWADSGVMWTSNSLRPLPQGSPPPLPPIPNKLLQDAPHTSSPTKQLEPEDTVDEVTRPTSKLFDQHRRDTFVGPTGSLRPQDVSQKHKGNGRVRVSIMTDAIEEQPGKSNGENQSRNPRPQSLTRALSLRTSALAPKGEAKDNDDDDDPSMPKLTRTNTAGTVTMSPVHLRGAMSESDLNSPTAESRRLKEDEKIKNGKSYRHTLRRIVLHPFFEYGVGVFLLLNAVSIGHRAQYRADNPSKKLGNFFDIVELIFASVFTAELVVRIYALDREFLRMKGWAWNAFDLGVVAMQDIEIMLEIILTDEAGTNSMSNILRILRLGRIVRLLRMVRLIPSLKSMVYLIAASMASFIWTLVLLAFLMFGLSVHFTEVVADFRSNPRPGEDIGIIVGQWGSITLSFVTLYQSILGGIDWKEVTDELRREEINWSVSAVYYMYIAFATLVMLNLVTGVFVEGAQRIVAEDRDLELKKQAKKMFDIVDDSADLQVSWHEFESHLNDQGMDEYFRLLGISKKEAKDLFCLLDVDRSGELGIGEFVHGCLNLRGPAKSLDLARIAYNHEILANQLEHIEERQLSTLAKVEDILKTSCGMKSIGLAKI
jgi:voltage-gated sodium channel